VEQLVGDRNGKLDALKKIDNGRRDRQPDDVTGLVRDAAQLLKGNVDRYIFISTISVYGEVKQGSMSRRRCRNTRPGSVQGDTRSDEASGYKNLRGTEGAFGKRGREKWFPGKALLFVGPDFGPRDETDRLAIGRSESIEAAKCSPREIRMIGPVHRRSAIWLSGRFEWVNHEETGIYNATGREAARHRRKGWN